MADEAKERGALALKAALAQLDERRREVGSAREALQVAEGNQSGALKDVGGAVRALRAELGISAGQMARMHWVGTTDALREYVNFEDEGGEIGAYRLGWITRRLLSDAAAPEAR